MTDHDPGPVLVHLTGSDVPLTPQQKSRAARRSLLFTLTFSALTPFRQVCGPDPCRVRLLVQAGGADVVLCKSQGEAQANTGDPAYAAPTGMLLPFGNAGPWPLDTTDELWAAAAVYPAQLAVTIITED